jgi:hypothetical protein
MIALSIPEPASLDDVLADLAEFDGQLGRLDGVRYFNRIYVAVTRGVRETVLAGALRDSAFVVALDVNFAKAYFDAVIAAEGGPAAAPPAWRPLFEARSDRRVAPIQLALAGMNAHINYDLPVQIANTARARGVGVDAMTIQHEDFVRLTPVFQRAEDETRRWLLTGLLHRLDRLFGSVDDTVAIWGTLRARQAAWTNGALLWHLRDDPARAGAVRDTLGHSTGAFGRGLVLPSVMLALGRLGQVLRGR